MMQRAMLWPVLLAASLGSMQAEAGFRSDAYPQCHALLRTAREHMAARGAEPYALSAALRWMGGFVSRLGAMAGPGGSALGAVAPQSALTRFGGLMDDTAAFTTAMQQEYGDAGLRLSAYSALLGEDSEWLAAALSHIRAFQQCYRGAYESLVAASVRGELPETVIRRRHAVISDDMALAEQMLSEVNQGVERQLHAFDAALQVELRAAGVEVAATGQMLPQTHVSSALHDGFDAALQQGLTDVAAMRARFLAMRTSLAVVLLQQNELANYLQRLPLAE